MINKKYMIVGGAFFLILIIVFAFLFIVSQQEEKKNIEAKKMNVEKSDWEKAKDFLHAGQVEGIMQTHSLKVTLKLKDGSEFKFVEPKIDAIFEEAKNCGEKCNDIQMATE